MLAGILQASTDRLAADRAPWSEVTVAAEIVARWEGDILEVQ